MQGASSRSSQTQFEWPSKRAKRKDKKTGRGGHNKVLSETQTEAIQGYCKEQYESGMGATKQMVFAAISHLIIQAELLQKPSS